MKISDQCIDELFSFELLEARTMMSADPFGLAEMMIDLDNEQESSLSVTSLSPQASTHNSALPKPLEYNLENFTDNSDVAAETLALSAIENPDIELIIIDSSIDNYQNLVADLQASDPSARYEFHFLNSAENAIEQLNTIFSQYQNLSAVHLFSHASEGTLQLGDQLVTQQVLLDNTSVLQNWQLAFNQDADFLFYGCNLVAGELGIGFVNTFAELTQLDVAASNDNSGSGINNSNWQLEFNSGNIESKIDLASNQTTWSGSLAAPVVINNNLVITQGDTHLLNADNLSATDDFISGIVKFTISNLSGGHFAFSSALDIPISEFSQNQISANEIYFVHDGGELAPSYDVTASDLLFSAPTSNAAINFSNDASGALWLGLGGQVNSGSGVPGLNDTAIGAGDIIQHAGPDFSMGNGTTDGNFSIAFYISQFSGSDDMNGMHFVSSDLSFGAANAVSLQTGDIIISTKGNVTLTSNGVSAAADLTMTKSDLVYFRPDQLGDYSRGNFYTLLEDPFGDGAEIRGVSLLEKDLFLGDFQLNEGDLLLARNGGPSHSDIWLLRTDTLDTIDASSYPAAQILINGEDAGADIKGQLSGIDILEEATNIGGINYDAGTLFISTKNGNSVGGNALLIDKYDIAALSVTNTTLGSGNAIVTASVMFDGNSVNLNSGSEQIDGFSLTYSSTIVDTTPSLTNNSFTLVEGQTTTITNAFLSATDLESSDATLLFSVSSVTGGEFQLTSNLGSPITSFLQSQIDSAEVIFIDDGNEIAPSFSISVTDSVNTSLPTAALINYQNVNDAPTITLTGGAVSYIEGSTGSLIFSAANADTLEVGQFFSAFSFTISNVVDGLSEQLSLDGGTIELVAGVGITLTNSLNYSVSVTANTATVSVTGSSLTSSELETLLNTLSYLNNSQDPTVGDRTITLTQLQDDGGSLNGGINTATPNIASVLTVHAVNDAPTVSLANNPVNYTEGDAPIEVFSAVSANTNESAQLFNAFQITVNNLTDGAKETLIVDGTALSLINGSGTTLNNSLNYTLSVTANIATVSISGGNLSHIELETLLNNISYQNNSEDPTPGNRAITLTHLQDNGGTLNSGSDSLLPNIGTLVNVIPINDVPSLANNILQVNQGQEHILNSSNLNILDFDDNSTDLVVNIITVDGGFFERVSNPGVHITSFTQVEITTGNIKFTDNNDTTAPRFSFTMSDGQVTSSTIDAQISFTATPLIIVDSVVKQPDFVDIQAPTVEPATIIEEVIDDVVKEPTSDDLNSHFNQPDAEVEKTTLVVQNQPTSEAGYITSLDTDLPETTQNKLALAVSDAIIKNVLLKANLNALVDPLLLLKTDRFYDSLDSISKNIERSVTIEAAAIGTGAALSTGLSIGYVAWLFRSGIILTSVLSSLPAWRFIDPLPILSSFAANVENQESLEDIVSENISDEGNQA